MTVRVKGQPNMATVTDLDGNFTLKAPKGATLQISYLGYKDKEVKSDNEAEHEYWLKGQVPNLFDKDYKRKWAYKGFCDGIAGEDLGLKYGGEEYKAFYEKNNVSSTVDK